MVDVVAQSASSQLEADIERIEAEGGDSEAGYEQLAAASERREQLGPHPPWPSV